MSCCVSWLLLACLLYHFILKKFSSLFLPSRGGWKMLHFHMLTSPLPWIASIPDKCSLLKAADAGSNFLTQGCWKNTIQFKGRHDRLHGFDPYQIEAAASAKPNDWWGIKTSTWSEVKVGGKGTPNVRPKASISSVKRDTRNPVTFYMTVNVLSPSSSWRQGIRQDANFFSD